MTANTDSEAVRQKVREGYGKIAGGSGSCCGATPSCCGSSPVASEDLAKHVGYTAEDLAALPDGANMGLSCGNPNALAALKPGENVLDLGSGGGFDVFIAGRKVGSSGRVIGVDMTPEMLAKARSNITVYREQSGLDNVEFRLGEIEHLPVADCSVDVIISNCVINLSPDKPQVWREIARVLKPGGRVAVSDLALLKPLPAEIAESVEALIGCVAGAVLVSETERMAGDAGLHEIALNARAAYIDGMVDWQDPVYQKIVSHLPAGTKPSDYITSLEITAHKPANTNLQASTPMNQPTPTLEVFDPAMCCSTGLCGPDVDPKLVQFAGDLDWIKAQGVNVQRHNLSQNPAAFVENEAVKTALTEKSEAALPILFVNGELAVSGRYPERGELIRLLKLPGTEMHEDLFTPAVAELVAIGAAIAANCEPCLKYHYQRAQLLGVSKADMASAVRMAARVKDYPHQAILLLAAKLLGDGAIEQEMDTASCCGDASGKAGGGCC